MSTLIFTLFLGLQVFYEVSLQLSLLLLAQTKTATVGGLETFFDRDEMFGVPMAPDTFIILSSFLSLKTSTVLHVKLLSLEKGYFGFKVLSHLLFGSVKEPKESQSSSVRPS